MSKEIWKRLLFEFKILILNLRGDLDVDYFKLQLLGNPVH